MAESVLAVVVAGGNHGHGARTGRRKRSTGRILLDTRIVQSRAGNPRWQHPEPDNGSAASTDFAEQRHSAGACHSSLPWFPPQSLSPAFRRRGLAAVVSTAQVSADLLETTALMDRTP